MLPFELHVLRAKTKYWAGDHMGYLDELSSLLGWCRSMSKKACVGITKTSPVARPTKSKSKVKRDEEAVGMWKERGARIILIMASQLIEMKAGDDLISEILHTIDVCHLGLYRCHPASQLSLRLQPTRAATPSDYF